MTIKTVPKIGLAVMALLCAGAHADERVGAIEIMGRGSVQAAPEYMALNVPVVSLCYNTAKAAKDANAVVANKLLTILKLHVRVKGDEVLASGGPTIRQSEFIEGQGTEKRKVLCDRKWRATNHLILKTASMDRLAEIQDAILSTIGAAEELNPARVEQTYAQLGQPSFHLYDQSSVAFRTQAQNKAFDDAKAQLAVFTSRCKFSKVKLTSISSPSFHVAPMRAAASPAGDLATPVIPDKVTVQATWKFVWNFEPVENCLLF